MGKLLERKIQRPFSIGGDEPPPPPLPPVLPRRKLYKLTKFFSGGAGGELRAAPLSVAEEGRNKVATFQVGPGRHPAGRGWVGASRSGAVEGAARRDGWSRESRGGGLLPVL